MMALQRTTRTYLDFAAWLRRCGHFWTHLNVRAVILETDDGPRALWTDVVLGDRGLTPPAIPKSARQIRTTFSSRPYSELPRLLRHLRTGRLPSWATGEPQDIGLSWKTDLSVGVGQFIIDLSPEAFGLKPPEKTAQEWSEYPRGILTFDLGLLPTWSSGREGRYPWLLGLDDQARRTGCRDLFDLGNRAGLLGEVAENSSSAAVPQLRIVAPYLVRIGGATVERGAGTLLVEVRRSKWLAARKVTVTLSETDRSTSLRPEIRARSRTRAKVRFKNVHGGHGELRLHDDVFDSYSRRQGIMREPFHRSARAAIANALEGGLEPLRRVFETGQGIAIEPALARLLFLLGWSPVGLSRNAPQPVDLPEGLLRFDILALGHRDSVLLAVECSSNWFGDDKLAKLVTRAREVEAFLTRLVAPSDVPRVLPVVAVTKEKGVAPPHLLEAAQSHGVGIIAREDLLELLTSLSVGEPLSDQGSRFGACFPEGSWLNPPNLNQEIGKYERW